MLNTKKKSSKKTKQKIKNHIITRENKNKMYTIKFSEFYILVFKKKLYVHQIKPF